MKEITKKLREELKTEFMPLAVQLREEGGSDLDIVKCLEKFKQIKIKRFYKSINENTFLKIIRELKIPEDSRAEVIFYNMLEKRKIPFNFQVKIGPYRVDYLIADYLVFEGDGPHHAKTKDYDDHRDRYLEKMGYKIFRVSWELVSQLPDRIIDVIKDELREYKLIGG